MGTQKITFGRKGDTEYQSKLAAAKAQAPYLDIGIQPANQGDNPANSIPSDSLMKTGDAVSGESKTVNPTLPVDMIGERVSGQIAAKLEGRRQNYNSTDIYKHGG